MEWNSDQVDYQIYIHSGHYVKSGHFRDFQYLMASMEEYNHLYGIMLYGPRKGNVFNEQIRRRGQLYYDYPPYHFTFERQPRESGFREHHSVFTVRAPSRI